MKTNLLIILTAFALFLAPNLSYGAKPTLGTTSTFALFTADGAFSNIGNATYVTGNVGNHVGQFTAFTPGTLVGNKHVADAVSTTAAADVLVAYHDLFSLTCGEVLDTLLGTNQTLTPNVYCIGAASTLKGDLILNAQGDPNALFIFKINGALSTSTFANVILTNSASLSNVYWQIGGAFSLGESSVFRGTIIADGAISLLEGSSLLGRGLSTAGAISLHNNVVTIPTDVLTGITSINADKKDVDILITPNPFGSTTTVIIKNDSKINICDLKIYNAIGKEVMNTSITKQGATLDMNKLQPGIYLYKVVEDNKTIQSGKLISKQ